MKGLITRVGSVLGLATAFLGVALDAPAMADAPTVSGPVTVVDDDGARSPKIAFDGDDFLVAWLDDGGGTTRVRAATVAGDGSVVTPLGQISDSVDLEDGEVEVASNGTNYLVVWSHRIGTADYDIRGQLLDGTGAPIGGDRLIVTDPAEQRAPAITAAGATFFVTWTDFRSGQANIHGRRVSGSGTLLDAASIPIATTSFAETESDVASNGTDFLVAYRRADGVGDRDLYARRLSLNATLLPGTTAISTQPTDERQPAVASNGTSWFVVWSDARNPADEYDIYGAEVSATGSLIDVNSVDVATFEDDQEAPDIAWNGQYLAAWTDRRPETNARRDVYAARISGGGTVADPDGYPIASKTTAIEEEPSVSAAPGSTRWAVDYTLIDQGAHSLQHRTTPK